MKVSEFLIAFSKQNVYRALDCFPGNPAYEEMEEEYAAIRQEAYSKLHPCAYLAFGRLPAWASNEAVPEGTEVLYVIKTLGGQISEWSGTLFQEGNYVAGMLADAMADDYLFQMDRELEKPVISMCREIGAGIEKRLEAPTGIGMEVQRAALEAVQQCGPTDVTIKESLMYDPLKTTCQVYLLKRGSQEYQIEHDCRECPVQSCKRRKVKPVWITVREGVSGQELVRIPCQENESIHQALTGHGIYLSAVCGGRGTCGKCGVRVLEGEIPASVQDIECYTGEELEAGMRLACRAYPRKDCHILLEAVEEGMSAVTEFHGSAQAGAAYGERSGDALPESLGIGIDIGTTTLAMQLVRVESGQILDTYTAVNRQRAYGADVISRILASNQGAGEALKQCIVKDLVKGVNRLLGKNGSGEAFGLVREIAVAGNTTMLHLLLGYSCKTLGVSPFMPVSVDTRRLDWSELTGEEGRAVPVVLLPGISTYVGADIAAGMLACGMDRTEEVTLLLDLGTNGEMALGGGGRILGASTAAGPAFEGGNISCGMGSIPGAICNVELTDGTVRVTTIQGAPPVGICGTGVVEAVYELLRAGWIDETGLMDAAYFDDGFVLAQTQSGGDIRLTQKDVREIQLAKSAIRAGIETLLLRFGVEAGQVARIYVAGGFGYRMDFDKAIGIGLLPEAFAGRITAVGNSSLNGALQYLMQRDAADRIEGMIQKTTEVSLSNDKDFNESYMEHMYFDRFAE